MSRWLVSVGLALALCTASLQAQEGPRRGKIKLSYVESGFYDGTMFHRVIRGFMIQGGGFTAQMSRKRPNPPIVNEASNGLRNDSGAISMARTNDPDSATCQFFINHRDNASLNYVAGGNTGETKVNLPYRKT